MQDLKNNSRTPGQGGDEGPQKQDARTDLHGFDQQLQQLLADAEVLPPPDLMDKIWETLDKAQPLNGYAGAKTADAGAAVRPLRQIRRKLSYAAAIGGILIALALGVREWVSTNAVLLPPAGLTALNTHTGKLPQQVHPGVAATENGALSGRKTFVEKKGKAAKAVMNADQNSAKFSGADELPQMSRPAAAGPDRAKLAETHGAAQAINPAIQQAVRGQPAVTENRPVTHPGNNGPMDAVVKTVRSVPVPKSPAAPAAGTAAEALSSDRGNADGNAVTWVDKDGAKEMVMGDAVPDAVAGLRAVADAHPDTDQAEKAGRGRGFLRGIFKKIGSSAKAISSEVVTQDDDKTVINVGILAITAYK